jgi:Ser/Thr protein kinase RdoA (MazF antagonist)
LSGNESFFGLTPDRVLDAVEASGLICTGRCFTLNSFENRVYDVELDIELDPAERRPSARNRIVKFYRPGRWSEAQILEEHRFLLDLAAAEIPAVAPLAFPDGRTLHRTAAGDIWYAIFPKQGGRAPDELTDEQLLRIGRLLARIHAVGAAREAPTRVQIGAETYGRQNLDFLLAGDWIPPEFRARYETVARSLFRKCDALFASGFKISQRIHGDCHLGNLILVPAPAGSELPATPYFVDFDDMVRGPAVQDVWLLVPGRDDEAVRQRATLIEGYEEMRVFDRASLALIEPLRALRFIHYTAWVARRWQDPAFPLAFPEFGTHRYWSDETRDLEEQDRLI